MIATTDLLGGGSLFLLALRIRGGLLLGGGERLCQRHLDAVGGAGAGFAVDHLTLHRNLIARLDEMTAGKGHFDLHIIGQFDVPRLALGEH